MLTGKDKAVLLLSLFLCASVQGATTVDYLKSDLLAGKTFLSTSTYNDSDNQLSEIFSSHDSYLTALIIDASRVPIISAELPLSTTDSARTLPAVPGALFMVLAGFLCISFVRDRRIWFAALITVAWLFQTGLTALPRLFNYHWARVHTKHNIKATYMHTPKQRVKLLNRFTGVIQIAQWEGLIPFSEAAVRTYLLELANCSSSKRLKSISIAGIGFSSVGDISQHLFPPDFYLTVQIEQPISFFPAFIFAVLPRGPPYC